MYKDFWNNTNRFDNSDYPENTPYFGKRNKEVIGILKDEAGGIPSNEFVGLRSEMYSYMKDSYKGSKTAKGIKKNVIKKVSNMKTIRTHYFTTDSCNIK